MAVLELFLRVRRLAKFVLRIAVRGVLVVAGILVIAVTVSLLEVVVMVQFVNQMLEEVEDVAETQFFLKAVVTQVGVVARVVRRVVVVVVVVVVGVGGGVTRRAVRVQIATVVCLVKIGVGIMSVGVIPAKQAVPPTVATRVAIVLEQVTRGTAVRPVREQSAIRRGDRL